METKLHTFSDIFNTRFPILGDSTEKAKQEDAKSTFVTLKKIVIPIIQRDYAQGRMSDKVKRMRKRFLHVLRQAVNGNPITLDFVYGDIDGNGVLTPLDGQQRLTTLFLLYWYAARKENKSHEESLFLHNFSYETRYTARDFCAELVRESNVFDFSTGIAISDDITNQSWFPLDWKKDPTIQSMLVMLDDIQSVFNDIENLWEKLQSRAISFYFLPISDMGLTDDIYIKMNSRGKPLTTFEHFKAELIQQLNIFDEKVAKRIMHKIDIEWTDLLWEYRGDNNIIDDEFLRYFTFICDIICYRQGKSPQGKSHDPFDLIDYYFSSSLQRTELEVNIEILESYFDCWLGIDGKLSPREYCESLMAYQHEEGKIKIENRNSLDIFGDCLRSYGEYSSNGNREFALNRTILLYAVVSHLRKHGDDYFRRLRIVYNLIRNSTYEISDSEDRQGGNRLPGILQQVDGILGRGEFVSVLGFNAFQIEEEKEKYKWTAVYPDAAEQLFTLEDHDLLYGQIGIVGLDNTENFHKFISLFKCDWRWVSRALLSVGDYRQKTAWWGRYQLGSPMNVSWRQLFHKGKAMGYEQTKETLNKLLRTTENFTDGYLGGLVEGYIQSCIAHKHYDWRYYFLKYDSFMPDRYGVYVWKDSELEPYSIEALYTQSRISSRAYNPFLYEVDSSCIDYDNGSYLQFEKHRVDMTNSAFRIKENDTNQVASIIDIPMKNGIDTTDRIMLAKSRLVSTI